MDCSLPGPLSMELPGQEFWSGLPFPSPRDLPDLGIEPVSPALQADSLPTELLGRCWERMKTKGEGGREDKMIR